MLFELWQAYNMLILKQDFMKYSALWILGILLISISACNKDEKIENRVNYNDVPLEEIVIPGGFQFLTSITRTIEVKMPESVDYSSNINTVSLWDGDPIKGGVMIAAGRVSETGIFESEITLPCRKHEVFVKSLAGVAKIDLNKAVLNEQGKVVYTYPAINVGVVPGSVIPGTKQGGIMDKVGPLNIKTGNQLLQNGNFSDNDLGEVGYWNSNIPMDGRWYVTSAYKKYTAIKNNNGNPALEVKKGKEAWGGVMQMIPAQAGEQISAQISVMFEGGSSNSAYLYLIPRGANGSVLSSNYSTYKTYVSGNPWQNIAITATMPQGTQSCEVLLYHYQKGGKIFYDDAVAYTQSTDTDNDGVADEDDMFPNDANRAYWVKFPADVYGSLAFEDLWPSKGDYDFNDLVVDYQFRTVTDAQNKLVEVYGKFAVRAIGASLRNGLGFQFSSDAIDQDNISVSGTQLDHGYIQLRGNGLEAGQNMPTIIVFDDAFKVTGGMGGFSGVNTDPTAPWMSPDSVTVHISFNQGLYSVADLDISNINPFLIVDGDRGREVHPAGKAPTNLANEQLFGTKQDDSGSGKYYQTENNLPWALQMVETYDYPKEKTGINKAHLHFVDWAVSGGNSYNDWYRDNSGYRNQQNIY